MRAERVPVSVEKPRAEAVDADVVNLAPVQPRESASETELDPRSRSREQVGSTNQAFSLQTSEVHPRGGAMATPSLPRPLVNEVDEGGPK
jgi:hypothetical protein